MERRRVRALSARTEFVPGYGQVHFNPGSSDEDVRHPLIPVSVIERLVDNGWIADDIDEEVARLPQLDHDDDGHPGGDKAEDVKVDEDAGFTLTDAGGGWWHITGPGLAEAAKVRGEDAAKARYDEIVAAATATDDVGEGDAPA